MFRTAVITVLFCMFCVSASASTVRGDLSERFPPKETICYLGVDYVPKENVTTILLLGVDTSVYREGIKNGHDYNQGGQSDFMLLIVIDEDTRTVTPIQIDRDTMANITMMDSEGNQFKVYQQICLSHGFGDGGAQSCEFSCEAVEWLFSTHVDHYIAMNLDAISVLNDAVGGVPVTVPMDMSFLDPQLYVGNTLTLRGEQAMYFVRSRYGIGNSSNADRMIRQRAYITSFADIIQSRVQADPNYIGTLFDTMQPLLTTDMRRGLMINIAWAVRDFQRMSTVSPAGEYARGSDGFIEFHPDQDALWQLEFSTFYEPAD